MRRPAGDPSDWRLLPPGPSIRNSIRRGTSCRAGRPGQGYEWPENDTASTGTTTTTSGRGGTAQGQSHPEVHEDRKFILQIGRLGRARKQRHRQPEPSLEDVVIRRRTKCSSPTATQSPRRRVSTRRRAPTNGTGPYGTSLTCSAAHDRCDGHVRSSSISSTVSGCRRTPRLRRGSHQQSRAGVTPTANSCEDSLPARRSATASPTTSRCRRIRSRFLYVPGWHEQPHRILDRATQCGCLAFGRQDAMRDSSPLPQHCRRFAREYLRRGDAGKRVQRFLFKASNKSSDVRSFGPFGSFGRSVVWSVGSFGSSGRSEGRTRTIRTIERSSTFRTARTIRTSRAPRSDSQ